MVLETLTPGAPINVRDLTMPEIAKPDPLEITAQDWRGMDEELLRLFEDANRFQVAQMSKIMKVLNPGRENPIIEGWNLDEKYFFLEEALVRDPGQLARIKVLYPHADLSPYMESQTVKRLIDSDVDRIGQELTVDSAHFGLVDIVANWPPILTLFPQIQDSTQISPQKIEQIKSTLESEYKDASNYPYVLARLRLFIPKEQLPGTLDSRDWAGLARELNRWRRERNWLMFAPVAETVQILKADEVKITENGWEIKMPPDGKFTAASEPLPEARRF